MIQFVGTTATKPATPATGSIWYDEVSHQFLVYNGATWTPLSIDLDAPVPELIFSTGTVFGNEYYTIEPHYYDWEELEAWCTDVFGLRGDIWSNGNHVVGARWYANSGRLWFRDLKDCDWFVLRWSSK